MAVVVASMLPNCFRRATQQGCGSCSTATRCSSSFVLKCGALTLCSSVYPARRNLSPVFIFAFAFAFNNDLLLLSSSLCRSITPLQPLWLFNHETTRMEHRDAAFVPGLFKIFDEILGTSLFFSCRCVVRGPRADCVSTARVSFALLLPQSTPRTIKCGTTR